MPRQRDRLGKSIFTAKHLNAKIQRVRTTVDLPDPLFREVKTRAVQQGMKLKDLLAQYIEAGLHAPPTTSGSAYAGPRRPFPIPIAREADGTVAPALTNAQLDAILEEEDLANHRRALNS